MSVVETQYEHIVIGDDQVPMIEGTTMKVIELVMEHPAFGWSPEELYLNHPYLTLGQIYSALAYYWDHKSELDQDIERRMQRVEEIRQSLKPTPLVERLKSKGLL
jgi:uncharacterized protein (DUF433 family)